MRLFYFLFIAHILTSSKGSASPYRSDSLLDIFKNKPSNFVEESFEGLRFRINKDSTTCSRDIHKKMSCELSLRHDGELRAKAHIIFERHSITSLSALPLIRLNRKTAWEKQYSSKNHYVEMDITVQGESRRLQETIYYRFDYNSDWPVLLRAFDVVMNNKTSISITTICDGHAWPMIREMVDSVISSINKAAK